MKTIIDLLGERIEKNYEDFKKETLLLSKKGIYEAARKIAAVEDVHFYMTTHDWVDVGEALTLLALGNPLEAIADFWEERLDDQNTAFGAAIRDFINSDDFEFFADYTDDDEDDYLRDEIDEALEILDEIEEQLGDIREGYERLARGLDI